MRRVSCVLAIALAILAAQPAGAVAGARAETAAALEAINRARAGLSIAPLRLSPALTRSSRAFGGRLMRAGIFAHAASIQAAGGFIRLGEALALHTGRAARPAWTVRRWLASPGHRGLLLDRGFRHAGAAAVAGRFRGRATTIWVLQLGGR